MSEGSIESSIEALLRGGTSSLLASVGRSLMEKDPELKASIEQRARELLQKAVTTESPSERWEMERLVQVEVHNYLVKLPKDELEKLIQKSVAASVDRYFRESDYGLQLKIRTAVDERLQATISTIVERDFMHVMREKVRMALQALGALGQKG